MEFGFISFKDILFKDSMFNILLNCTNKII